MATKISTTIETIALGVGDEKAVEFVAKAGFDAFDYSFFTTYDYNWDTMRATPKDNHPFNKTNYADYMKYIRKIGEDNGIVCNQTHSPFPVCSKDVRNLLKKSIECSAILGAELTVIHPDNDKTAEENAEMYFELLPFAKEHNVKIATENMWNWKDGEPTNAACSSPEDFKKHIDVVNDPFLIACVDIGHAEMRGMKTSAVEIIKTLGHRVQALHLHDNDKVFDLHAIPFTMNVEFEPIVKALKEIDYKGYFTLEVSSRLKGASNEQAFEKVKELFNSAKRLAEMFDNMKI